MSPPPEDITAQLLNDPEDYVGNQLNRTQQALHVLIRKFPGLDSEMFHGLVTWHQKVGTDLMDQIREAVKSVREK